MAKRYVAKQLVDTMRVSPYSGCRIFYPSGRITLMEVDPPPARMQSAKTQSPYLDETFGSLEELELRCAAEGIPWEDVDVSQVSGGRLRESPP